VGPHKITREITPNTSYEVELPSDLKRRGIHPVFHASLLRIHKPMDDRRFPGREFGQIVSLGGFFEILWKSGDRTWEPYSVVRRLEALNNYFEALGVTSPKTSRTNSHPTLFSLPKSTPKTT